MKPETKYEIFGIFEGVVAVVIIVFVEGFLEWVFKTLGVPFSFFNLPNFLTIASMLAAVFYVWEILHKHIGSKINFAPKPKSSLMNDITMGSYIISTELSVLGYNLDFTLESMKEIDRFFDEQKDFQKIFPSNSNPNGLVVFCLGAYIGEVAIKLYGGEWIVDDKEKDGEINICVEFPDQKIRIFPVLRCMKRFKDGKAEGIYAYLVSLKKPIDESSNPHYNYTTII